MRVALHTRMLLGGAVGVLAGLAAHEFLGESEGLAWTLTHVAQPVGQIFFRLLFMLVIPLIFSALVLGVAGLGDLRHLGRVGLRTLAYTVVVSSIAVLLGIVLVQLLRPGEGLSEEARQRLLETASQRAAGIGSAEAPKTGVELLVRIVPSNPFAAAAEGDMLAVMFFSLMVGIGVAVVRTDAARKFEEVVQGLYDVTMRLIGMVIAVAPIGIAALLFSMTAQLGLEVVVQLARYVGVVLLALAIHQFGIYALSVKLLGGISPLHFYRSIDEAMVTAFSTASSNATLPTALRVAQEKLQLPPHVARFVLTIGSTANQNGTALYEGVTVLFLAQFYGVHLSLGDQVLVVGICILAGIGTAGIPGGSLPVIAMILKLVHVPPEGIGLILGVDRFLDMCRTTLNVTGDLAAAVVVSRGEEVRPR